MLKGVEGTTFLKVTESIIKLVKIFNKDRQCMVRVFNCRKKYVFHWFDNNTKTLKSRD